MIKNNITSDEYNYLINSIGCGIFEENIEERIKNDNR